MIKHYSLRLILWLNGHTPLNFIKFLDQCAKLIFLKKVGGGYIFIHRMLWKFLGYLAEGAERYRVKVHYYVLMENHFHPQQRCCPK